MKFSEPIKPAYDVTFKDSRSEAPQESYFNILHICVDVFVSRDVKITVKILLIMLFLHWLCLNCA